MYIDNEKESIMEFIAQRDIERVMSDVVDLFVIPRFNSSGYKGGSMKASGNWLNNLKSRADISTGVLKGVISAPKYTEQLAKGRKPGSLPPISKLTEWAKIRFNADGEEARRIAWAVAKKIEKDGTRYYQDGGTKLVEVLSEQATIQYIKDRLTAIVRVIIADNLVRIAKETFRT